MALDPWERTLMGLNPEIAASISSIFADLLSPMNGRSAIRSGTMSV